MNKDEHGLKIINISRPLQGNERLDIKMGIKFTHTGNKIDFALAFFANQEELRFGSYSDTSDSRYSYDIALKDLDGDGTLHLRNKETNQLNGKINYKFGNKKVRNKLGASIQYGGVQNLYTKKIGTHYAFGGHYELSTGKFNLKAQISNYKISAQNPSDEPSNISAMTAYGFPYFVASKATTYTLGSSYSIPVSWGPISNIQIYNDFGYMVKCSKGFQDNIINVTGALFTAGKHMPWLNPDFNHSLAQGSSLSDKWEVRFNINMGYYF